MRGKPIHKIIVSRLFGITPAGAGKTVLQCCIVRATADHPRGCGENSNVASGNFSAAGSPPRMRGKQLCFRPPTAENRITPADAGKTEVVSRLTAVEADHPRGCGENRNPLRRVGNKNGSPPRMRGKPSREEVTFFFPRITPADAGKTIKDKKGCYSQQDHPRGCGENLYLQTYRQGRKGSPPRMRGKLSLRAVLIVVDRITPADAGKTQFTAYPTNMCQDHPRGCGENTATLNEQTGTPGSPPRMRGKLIQKGKQKRLDGITPADAGKTWQPQHIDRNLQDHPRGCGENTKKIL